MASQKADKVAAATPPDAVPVDRETDEYIVNFLKIRINSGKILTWLEAELEGKAQEMQALQHYHRTMPKCSSTRPHKRARLQDDGGATTLLPEGTASELPPVLEASGAPPAATATTETPSGL